MSALLTFGYASVNPRLGDPFAAAYASNVSIGHAPLPPHVQLFDFLPESKHARLLEWALNNFTTFEPATVTSGKGGDQIGINANQRIALTTRKLGDIEGILKPDFAKALDRIAKVTGYRGPAPFSLKLELAAHGDGAHYIPHLDNPITVWSPSPPGQCMKSAQSAVPVANSGITDLL